MKITIDTNTHYKDWAEVPLFLIKRDEFLKSGVEEIGDTLKYYIYANDLSFGVPLDVSDIINYKLMCKMGKKEDYIVVGVKEITEDEKIYISENSDIPFDEVENIAWLELAYLSNEKGFTKILTGNIEEVRENNIAVNFKKCVPTLIIRRDE